MGQKRSTEEGLRIVEEFEGSGLPRRQFCEQKNIPLTTLDYWRWKKNRATKPRLVEVAVDSKETALAFHVVLANRRRIEGAWNFREDDLARLIRVVEGA
jgi:hypothetical protein